MFTAKLISLARTYFEVELPVSSIVMKKAYRRQCIKLHPDTGGNEQQFKEMHAAYTQLTDFACVADLFSEEPEFRNVCTTTDGTPLAELGLGLGHTVNGIDCPDCQHRGYVEVTGIEYVQCKHCGGSGYAPVEEPCKACIGTGKFTQARSKRVVDCRVCKGTGKFMHAGSAKNRKAARYRFRFGSICLRCSGHGEVEKKIKTTRFHRCYKCEGTGELPMWNPVLPKAALL